MSRYRHVMRTRNKFEIKRFYQLNQLKSNSSSGFSLVKKKAMKFIFYRPSENCDKQTLIQIYSKYFLENFVVRTLLNKDVNIQPGNCLYRSYQILALWFPFAPHATKNGVSLRLLQRSLVTRKYIIIELLMTVIWMAIFNKINANDMLQFVSHTRLSPDMYHLFPLCPKASSQLHRKSSRIMSIFLLSMFKGFDQ